jgi:DUF1680 family protein
VNLYGSNRLQTKLSDGHPVKLSQETEYPWNGRVRFKLEECGPAPFTLKLRIPGWAARATVRINNSPSEDASRPSSYVELRRVWHPGDTVELDMPMPVRLMEANPLVEETLNQIAVQRGPLVYCLESTDLPRGSRVLDIQVPANVDLVARYDERFLGGVVVLEGQALLRPEGAWNGSLYRDFRPAAAKTQKIRLIPYFAWGNRGPSEMTVWMPRAN